MDRELLEMAAKAISLPECGWMGPAFMYVKDNRFTDWNPLTDDGDALRLAVKLGISVEPEYKDEFGVLLSYASIPSGGVFIEDHREDRYAATRRAIVCAAAEIGMAM